MNAQLKKIRKDLREDIKKEITKTDKAKKKVSLLYLPEFPVEPKARLDIFKGIDLIFPYDPKIIKEIQNIMINDGWYTVDLLNQCQLLNCYKSDMTVDIKFSINHEDSTCVKTKIGEKEQTVSIYEISCKEGAEEKTFIHKEVEEKE